LALPSKTARRLPQPHLSEGEERLALHLRAALLPPPGRQFRFAVALGRKYAFDFCWQDRMLAVEIDGSVHRIKGRFRGDLERHNLAQLLGWRVLRFSPDDVKSGRALGVLEALFAGDESAALAAVQGSD
jgi:very-short-patch-repair endonuclease